MKSDRLAMPNRMSIKESAPVTPLLTFTLDHLGGKDQDSKGRVKMRFWIDSDSPPCMSDISVAVSYDFLSSNLRHAPQLTKSQAIDKTFQPYDGSSRYHFFRRVLRWQCLSLAEPRNCRGQ